jgi:hypothetical protein
MLNNIFYFLKNIIIFRKFLWNHKLYDYNGVFISMKIVLYHLKYELKLGPKFEEDKNKRIKKIERVINILDNILEEKYINISEEKYGKIEYNFENDYDDNLSEEDEIKNKKILDYKKTLEKSEWEELFSIIKGTNLDDGSDIRRWWR